MRCLVDEALPRLMAESLRAAGIDCVDARDVGLKGRPDKEILAYAVQHGYSLLTLDRGFANTVRLPQHSHPGILIGRFPDTISTSTLVRCITDQITNIANEDLSHTLVVLQPGRIRMRRPRNPIKWD